MREPDRLTWRPPRRASVALCQDGATGGQRRIIGPGRPSLRRETATAHVPVRTGWFTTIAAQKGSTMVEPEVEAFKGGLTEAVTRRW